VPTYRTLLALPNALRIPLAGMALLLVGGAADTLWHNIFGIERQLEIFVSPSHELIIIGMVLVAAGPVLMLATQPGRRLSLSGAVLATISTLLAVLPVHIYSLHASALGTGYLGRPGRLAMVFSFDAQMLHGYLFSTVLLLLPIVIMGRRWRLPWGVPTLLVAFPSVLMHLMFYSEEFSWPSVTVAVAAGATELVLRVADRFVRLPEFVQWPEEARWIAAGLLAPPLVWGTLVAAAAVRGEVGWNVHMISGLLTLVAFTGAATVLVTRHVQPWPAAPPR
jgi:hypothetical protein